MSNVLNARYGVPLAGLFWRTRIKDTQLYDAISLC